MAIAICPTRTAAESPSDAYGNWLPATRTTARSVSGSSPTTSPRAMRPSANVTRA